MYVYMYVYIYIHIYMRSIHKLKILIFGGFRSGGLLSLRGDAHPSTGRHLNFPEQNTISHKFGLPRNK